MNSAGFVRRLLTQAQDTNDVRDNSNPGFREAPLPQSEGNERSMDILVCGITWIRASREQIFVVPITWKGSVIRWTAESDAVSVTAITGIKITCAAHHRSW